MPSTLHRTSTPQLVKASGTVDDPYILENTDIDVRTLSNAGLTLLNAQHILVRTFASVTRRTPLEFSS